MSRLTNTLVPSHIVSLAENLHRLNILEKYGFTEQNNIPGYKAKLAKNKPAQTLHKVKALADNARKLSLFVNRREYLA